MSQKTEDRSYNLRPRNNKGNVAPEKPKSKLKPIETPQPPCIEEKGENQKKIDDETQPLPLEYGCEECHEQCDEECECECHIEDEEIECECDCNEEQYNEECECECHTLDAEEEVVLEVPTEVMDEINLAIQDLVQEVTEDIVMKISEIVVTSVENNIDNGEGEEIDTEFQLEEDDEDSEYKPSDVFKMFDAGFNNEEMGFFPRKRLYLSKNRWKNGLTEEEVEKYSHLFEDLKFKDKLNIPQILRANLSENEKERAIKRFLNSHPGSTHSVELAKMIKQRETNPVSDEELKQIDELDNRLAEVKDNRSTLKEKIYRLPVNLDKKSTIYEKYLQLESLSSTSTESSKLREWLNWAIKLPWDRSHKLPEITGAESEGVNGLMTNIKKQLDDVYGLKNAKEEIMMYVLRRMISDQRNALEAKDDSTSKTTVGGQILAIEGSPGVGKTFLLKHLASALNIPFESIPLGGCKDSSFLDGHGYTYEGSVPGRIVQALKNMGCNNGIIYFDEIDKLSESQHGQEVSALMLHILDPSQNKEFYDKYIGDIAIDLSKIFFVLSINNREKIDPVLRQRLFIIKIPDPTVKDKVQIAKQCMLPSIQREFGFNEGDVTFTDETLNYIIKTKTNDEKGVRNFKHLLLAVYKRLLFLHKLTGDETSKQLDMSFWIDDFKLPVVVTTDMVNHLLKGTEQTTGLEENAKKMYL